jgi:hypothetical protein
MVMERTLDSVKWMTRGGVAEVHDTDTFCACVIALRLTFPASYARDRYWRSVRSSIRRSLRSTTLPRSFLGSRHHTLASSASSYWDALRASQVSQQIGYKRRSGTVTKDDPLSSNLTPGSSTPCAHDTFDILDSLRYYLRRCLPVFPTQSCKSMAIHSVGFVCLILFSFF